MSQFKSQKNLLGKFLDKKKVNKPLIHLINEKHQITDPYFYYLNEEILLINPFTIMNYEMSLLKCYHNIIYDLSAPIDPHELYSCIIFLIQGIPSQLFVFNYKKFSFKMKNKSIRLIGTTNDLISSFLKEFIDFGNCIFTIRSITEYYLFKKDNTPFLLKKFFGFLNDFLIKLNEKFINLKTRLIFRKDLHLNSLLIKLKKYSELINLAYCILKLPEIVNDYRIANKNNYTLDNTQNTNINKNKNDSFLMNEFLDFFSQRRQLNSSDLLDSLFSLFYFFNVKDSNYFLIKNLLINTLKSYMKYIYYIIFNNEIIDNTQDLFLNKNQNEIFFSINNKKIPEFLISYKNYILNISILLNQINKFDLNYFKICNLKLVDFIEYIDDFDFEDPFTDDSITHFISIKDNFFKIKFDLIDNFSQIERVKNKYILRLFIN